MTVPASEDATRERGITFDVGGDTLVGVLHEAHDADARNVDAGLVVVVGGPQYRVGSHRQFLALARHVAAAGVPVLRFDCRGMGDSEGEPRAFDTLDDDIAGAIDTLARETHITRVVLWGLCDGASAAMMYAWRDARVSGLVLLNPWVQSEAGEAKARVRHYYAGRVFNRDTWRRLLRGELNVLTSARGVLQTLARLARRNQAATDDSGANVHFIERMRDGWERFEGDSALIMSGNDLTAAQFDQLCSDTPAWRSLARSKTSERIDIDGASHTFSRQDWKDAVAAATLDWVRRHARPAAAE